MRTRTTAEGKGIVFGLSWDQPDTGGTIPAYQLCLYGKLTITIVWRGSTPPAGRAEYWLTLDNPAVTRCSLKIRPKLPDGTWGDFPARRTVVLLG